jgi:hypothetical protein
MIRTIAIPQESNFTITIPKEYIGKEIEFMYYPTVEIKVEQLAIIKNNNPIKLSNKYRAVFTKEDAKSFNEHTQQMRKEWDNI